MLPRVTNSELSVTAAAGTTSTARRCFIVFFLVEVKGRSGSRSFGFATNPFDGLPHIFRGRLPDLFGSLVSLAPDAFLLCAHSLLGLTACVILRFPSKSLDQLIDLLGSLTANLFGALHDPAFDLCALPLRGRAGCRSQCFLTRLFGGGPGLLLSCLAGQFSALLGLTPDAFFLFPGFLLSLVARTLLNLRAKPLDQGVYPLSRFTPDLFGALHHPAIDVGFYVSDLLASQGFKFIRIGFSPECLLLGFASCLLRSLDATSRFQLGGLAGLLCESLRDFFQVACAGRQSLFAFRSNLRDQFLATLPLLSENSLESLQLGFGFRMGFPLLGVFLLEFPGTFFGLLTGLARSLDLLPGFSAQLAECLSGLALEFLARFGRLSGCLGSHCFHALIHSSGCCQRLVGCLLVLSCLRYRLTRGRQSLELRLSSRDFGRPCPRFAGGQFLREGLYSRVEFAG